MKEQVSNWSFSGKLATGRKKLKGLIVRVAAIQFSLKNGGGAGSKM